MKILRFYISEKFFIYSSDRFPGGITLQFCVHVFDCFLKLCLSWIVFKRICEISNIKHKLFSINIKISELNIDFIKIRTHIVKHLLQLVICDKFKLHRLALHYVCSSFVNYCSYTIASHYIVKNGQR